MNLENKFNFKLGKMYDKEDIGYDVIFHAELKEYPNGNKLYYISWQPVDNEIPHVKYDIEQVENAILEGYWVLEV